MNQSGQKVRLEVQPSTDADKIKQIKTELGQLLNGFTLRPYLLFTHKNIIFRVAHLEPDLQIQVDDKTEIEIVPGPIEHFSNLIKVQTLESILGK